MELVQGAARSLPARLATQTHFFVAGLVFATWGVHVPTVAAAYALSAAELSWLMLAAGLGALIGLSRVGAWVGGHGARRVILVAGPLFCASLALLLAMPGYGALLVLLFGFGLCFGSLDVAMNAEAAAVEAVYARPIMSSFHGFFSLGGLAGAALGVAAAWAGLAPALQLLVVAVLGGAAIVFATRSMLPASATRADEAIHHTFTVPRGAVLLLGTLALLGMVGEGAMYDWSALYLVGLGADQSMAAAGYGAFCGAMAAGRFVGDPLRARLGFVRTLILSASLAALAMVVAVAIGHAEFAVLGFALVGLGFANLIPTLIAEAARVPGVATAQSIAGVAGMGYLGMMLGPPLIGAVATVASLGWGLVLVALLTAVVGWLAPRAAAGRPPQS